MDLTLISGTDRRGLSDLEANVGVCRAGFGFRVRTGKCRRRYLGGGAAGGYAKRLRQTLGGGERGRLCACYSVGSVTDVANLATYRPMADEQLVGYLSVGLASGDEA